jgi:YidC/Oxa1 family membrane protein insertase
MLMDMRRLFLFMIFFFSLFVLWSEWVRQNQPAAAITATAPTDASIPVAPARTTPQPAQAATTATAVSVEPQKAPAGKKIVVKTDTFSAEINTAGGNLQHLELLKHKDTDDQSKPFTLLQQKDSHIYVAQSGLLGKGLPTHNAEYTVAGDEYRLPEGKDSLEVRLTALESSVARVIKVYTFHRGSYEVEVAYEIENLAPLGVFPVCT